MAVLGHKPPKRTYVNSLISLNFVGKFNLCKEKIPLFHNFTHNAPKQVIQNPIKSFSFSI